MKKIIAILLAVVVCIGLVVFLTSPAGHPSDPTTIPTISTTIPINSTATIPTQSIGFVPSPAPPWLNESAYETFTQCATAYKWGAGVVDTLMTNIPDLDIAIRVIMLEDLHYKIIVGDTEYFVKLNTESREVLTITYEGITIFPIE